MTLIKRISSALSIFATVVSAVDSNLNLAVTAPSSVSSLQTVDRNLISWSIQDRDYPVYAKSNHLRNFFNILSVNTRVGQSVRLGGGESDKTSYDPAGTITAAKYESNSYGTASAGNVTLGPNYFASFKDIYASDTRYTFCLNLINETNNFEAAVSTASGVIEKIGSQLDAFEIGNEADFYGSKGYRDSTWNASEMLPQWTYIANTVQQNYPNTTLKFWAGGFANPVNSVTADFDIPGIIEAGFTDSRISWYTMHFYAQSGCNKDVLLDSLLNHTTLYETMNRYVSQVTAAESVGAQFAIGESNTVSCSGRAGVSDTLASALWLVDYVLGAASVGIKRVYIHATDKAAYSPVLPVTYSTTTGTYSAGVLPLAYGAYFISEVLAENSTLSVAPMVDANATDLSGYTLWDSSNNLKKVVLVNMEVYNGSIGTSNPATADTPVYPTEGDRPSTAVNISTTWTAGSAISIIKLQGPGANAKSLVNVSDLTFSSTDASISSNLVDKIVTVGANGYISFDILASEAALLQLYSDTASNPHPTSSGSNSSSGTPTSTMSTTGTATITRGSSSTSSSTTKTSAGLQSTNLNASLLFTLFIGLILWLL